MVNTPKSVEEAANRTLGSENVADFQSRLASLRSEISGLTDTLTSMSANGSEQARAAVAAVFAEMKSKGSKGMAEAEATANDAVDTMVTYARQYPMRSLGIAAGIGVILGLLFGRK